MTGVASRDREDLTHPAPTGGGEYRHWAARGAPQGDPESSGLWKGGQLRKGGYGQPMKSH